MVKEVKEQRSYCQTEAAIFELPLSSLSHKLGTAPLCIESFPKLLGFYSNKNNLSTKISRTLPQGITNYKKLEQVLIGLIILKESLLEAVQ